MKAVNQARADALQTLLRQWHMTAHQAYALLCASDAEQFAQLETFDIADAAEVCIEAYRETHTAEFESTVHEYLLGN